MSCLYEMTTTQKIFFVVIVLVFAVIGLIDEFRK